MKALSFVFTLLMSHVALADVVMPTCKINNLKDAKACMEKVALAYPAYEEANEVMVSTRKDLLIKVSENSFVSLSPANLRKVKAADYVGAMLQHGDEHEILYFAMKKGTTKPAEVATLYVVDFGLTSPLTIKDIFLGSGFDGSDIIEDLQMIIDEFSAED